MPDALPHTEHANTRCCIAGGGPAGMMLGYLLARAGVDVTVLEKHADFLRDFRGDTVHPSTLEVIHELGLLDDSSKLPHTEESARSAARSATRVIRFADFSHLPTHAQVRRDHAAVGFPRFPGRGGASTRTFDLRMTTEAVDLVRGGRPRRRRGRAKTPAAGSSPRRSRDHRRRARLRAARQGADFKVDDVGAPIDVLWLRLPRAAGRPRAGAGTYRARARARDPRPRRLLPVRVRRRRRAATTPSRRKGWTRSARARRSRAGHGGAGRRAHELGRHQAAHRHDRPAGVWHRPGLLCIGDAAHAMSPVGGVGINLAIQDAVCAANILAAPLRRGVPSLAELQAVQRRRTFPTHATQRLQLLIQDRVLSRTLRSGAPDLAAARRPPAARPSRVAAIAGARARARVPSGARSDAGRVSIASVCPVPGLNDSRDRPIRELATLAFIRSHMRP